MNDPTPSEPTGLLGSPGPDPIALEYARRRVRAQLLGDESEPLRIARFTLERQLGSGGLGTVWLAADAQLGRQVALKFLRDPERHPLGSQRLLREAQGLAQLSHPNVVQVFEVGEHEGRVWIAMEHVPGRTLREWAEQATPSADAILSAWVAAGRGLAAVHAAGLVHRDVKPDNVMVGDDERVRLIDFGLVRESGSLRPDAATTDPGAGAGADDRLTERGHFVGTKAYAAPEQRLAARVDAQADQFAFCVSVVEALTGVRARRTDAPELGRIRSPRVRAALRKGLQPNPDARHVDMNALLAALEPPSRRWIAPTFAAAAMLAASVLWFNARADRERDPARDDARVCASAGRAFDDSWGPRQRQLVEDRFGPSTGLALALDDWRDQWGDVARTTCERVQIDHTASPAALDATRSCLEIQRREFDHLLTQLERDDAPTPAEFSRWIAELPDPSTCLDARGAPLTAGEVQRLAELGEALFRARYGLDEPSMAARRARALTLQTQARASGIVLAEVRAASTLGALAVLAGDEADARAQFGEMLDLAERADLDDAKIQAHLWLATVALDLDLDLDDARWQVSRADSTLARLEGGTVHHARAKRVSARIALVAGDLDRAEALGRASLEAITALGPSQTWQRAIALQNLAQVARARGDKAEAERLLAEAEADLRFGDEPETNLAGSASTNAGVTALINGDVALAERELSRALADIERVYGPWSRHAADVHLALVAVHDATGDLEAARTHALTADAIVRSVLGPTHFDRTYALSGLGVVAYREGDFERSASAFELTARIAEAKLDGDSPELASHRINLADALSRCGRGLEAEALLRPAMATIEAKVGPDALELAIANKALGATLRARGDFEGARSALHRALEIHLLDSEPSVAELADTRWLLARTLADMGERDRAREQGEAAERLYAGLGEPWRAQAEEIQTWLQLEHPNPNDRTR